MGKAKLILILAISQTITALGNASTSSEDQLARGKYIFKASGCVNCHTEFRNKPLAGGRGIVTDKGTFYPPNITPDPDYGIGRWTEKDFLKSMKKGISPKGKYYYPSFVFTSYTKLTDDDIIAMKKYMDTFAPIHQPNKPHELKFPMNLRAILLFWRSINFKSYFFASSEQKRVTQYKGTYRPNKNKSKSWNNGAYLVEGALHCTECHTPRSGIGGLDAKKWMAGAPYPEENNIASNITPDKETGLGNWSEDDWMTFLTDGSRPDGSEVVGEMYKIVRYDTAPLSESDRRDVVNYLRSLKPINNTVSK